MRNHCIALFLILGLASFCHAEKIKVPSWLPADQRFEVDCTSNEIAQIDHTLALMRDAIHPKLRAQMRPEYLGPTLNWIAHVSLPDMTNETAFFDSYKMPIASSFFTRHSSFALLTNRASRLSYVPPIVNLVLVYDDGTKYACARPIPGIDYPGVSYEDEGSTPYCIRLTLRAIKSFRQFCLRADVSTPTLREVEFRAVAVTKFGGLQYLTGDMTNHKRAMGRFSIGYSNVKNGGRVVTAIFARYKGGLWGPPAFIEISADPLCLHNYDKNGVIEYVDYGSFRDIYKLDGQNRILGFERSHPDMVRKDAYSNFGEKIIETYPDDKPKTTRKVRYSVEDCKLTYTISEDDIHYKNGPFQFRPINF